MSVLRLQLGSVLISVAMLPLKAVGMSMVSPEAMLMSWPLLSVVRNHVEVHDLCCCWL